MKFPLKQIAEFIKAEIRGEDQIEINNLADIQTAKAGEITFLSNLKYEDELYKSNASAVIVKKGFEPKKEVAPTLLVVDDPYTAFALLLTLVEQHLIPHVAGVEPGVHIADSAKIGEDPYIGSGTVICDGVQIGNNVKIYPGCYIGHNVSIGDDTVIHPGVKIMYNSKIGSNCSFLPGAVIGSEGFGFAPQEDGSYVRIPQLGNVIIEDNVSIGSNTTIDRATVSATIIRNGAKIDNQVQIAHNCEVGENTVIAGQTGIAGSTKIGKNCQLAGQVGVSGHITIADGTRIGPQSGIMSSIKDQGREVMGTPILDVKEFMRVYAASKKVPELIKRVQHLENGK